MLAEKINRRSHDNGGISCAKVFNCPVPASTAMNLPIDGVGKIPKTVVAWFYCKAGIKSIDD